MRMNDSKYINKLDAHRCVHCHSNCRLFTSISSLDSICEKRKKYQNSPAKMSIFIENVIWSQTDHEIVLKIPIQGKKITDNVIITDKFIKVNFNPYYYELFFEKPIRVEESVCKTLESCIKCTLKKLNKEWWDSLGTPSKVCGKSNEKSILNELRKGASAEYEQKVQEETIHKQNEKTKLKRNVMDKTINREQEIRARIADAEEKLKQEQMLEDPPKQSREETVEKSYIGTSSETSTIARSNSPTYSMPPIRSSGVIDVTFSERRFVTPKRESTDQMEREWCAKQHEIMTKNIGFCHDDLNDNERDPKWLLDKGHDFLQKKNYLGAISAYSSGLRVAKDSPDLLLGRAEAHFYLGNFKRCVSKNGNVWCNT